MNCIRCGTQFDHSESSCPECAWDPDETLDKMAGYRVGEIILDRYEILESLGIGCLGTVVKAMDQEAELEVAFKVIHPALTPDRMARDDFMGGMRSILQFGHEVMADVYDVNQDEDDRCFVVYELLEGMTLRKLIENRRAREDVFSIDEVLPIIEQVVTFYQETDGIVHGSLSPEKIWIMPQQLKITGTGIAKYLPPGAVWHLIQQSEKSSNYVAPELNWGLPPDFRADVFSLGALVKEMLTQPAPDGQPEVLCKSNPNFAPQIDSILECALQSEPSARYHTPADLLVALSGLQSQMKSSPAAHSNDTYIDDYSPIEEEEPAFTEDQKQPINTPEPDSIFDDTAQVSMEDVIRAHTESDNVPDEESLSKEPSPAVQIKKLHPPSRPTKLGALAQAKKRKSTAPPRASAPARRPGSPSEPPSKRTQSDVPPIEPKHPVVNAPSEKKPLIEPKRPSRPSRDLRPPSYVPPPVAQKADDPGGSNDNATTPAGRKPSTSKYSDVLTSKYSDAGVKKRDRTQEIELSDLQAVENQQNSEDTIQEIELDMVEITDENGAKAAVEKLEKQANKAERESANELLRRADRLDGVDPRLVRAAHTLESNRRGGRSKQAAELLRKRAEDLDGIDPRLLRAAARLEEIKICKLEGKTAEEQTEESEESEEPEVQDDNNWREQMETPPVESVISFLSPPVNEHPADVRGFPKNQKRGARSAATSNVSRTAEPRRTPPPSRRR
ncbi:MAG: protein kinase [Proteobacteria bacterium]|nr:protein kinase [Pseudomonadota bacterium]